MRFRGTCRECGTHLGNSVLNHLLVRHIALVADEQLVDALGGVPVNFLQPLLDVVEAVHVGDVVDDADAVGTAVIGRRDCPESFLAGGIPLWQRSLVSQLPGPALSDPKKTGDMRTICSFTVLPSSSIVRIFCLE